MNQKKRILLGWIIAFGAGYMTSSKAGKFIIENLHNQITFVVFGVNFIVFLAQCMVILICYWGIKVNSKMFKGRNNVHDKEKALKEIKLYKKFTVHLYFLFLGGTFLSGMVIIINYDMFGWLITTLFILFSIVGFGIIYNEAKLSYSEMNIKNTIKRVMKKLNFEDKDSQMVVILVLLWIVVILIVALLRHPTFVAGELIRTLL